MNRAAACAIGLMLSMCAAAALAAPAPAKPAAPNPVLAAEAARPPLAFREDFSNEPNETPVTAASITAKDMGFATYGPGKDMVSKTYHANRKDETGYIWTGACTALCGFTLVPKTYALDMRGKAKITWRTQEVGLHQLRLMIKLADGRMLVSDTSVGATSDWQVSDMFIADIRWRELDTKYMNDASAARGAGPWAETVDLSKVLEIGWTDLQAGSGHGTMGGSSRIDWIEVYARKVPLN